VTLLWTFIAFALAEAWRAWRLGGLRRFASRAGVNLTLMLLTAALSVLLFGVSVMQIAAIAQGHGVGLLRLFALPDWLAVALGVVLLDLAEYVLHRLSHQVGWLWRLHALHHSDRDVDVTTSFRFHPLGVFVMLGWQLAVMVALGVPGEAVLLRETANSLWAMFQHSSAGKYGYRWQMRLRHLLVMPAVHHYHHSQDIAAQSGNFGAMLACWDQLFGTAIRPPATVCYGLADEPIDSIGRALTLPFRMRLADADAALTLADSATDAAQRPAGTEAEQAQR